MRRTECSAIAKSRGWLKTGLLVMAILAVTGYSKAQNLGFMPGDAFFAVLLDEKLAASAPLDGGRLVLPNMGPRTSQLNFGGFAGFDYLQINGVSAQMMKDIRRVYYDQRRYVPRIVSIRLRDDGTREETEVNPLFLMVYNRDVDWEWQRIGFKYNEDWPNLPRKAFEGPDRDVPGVGFLPAEVYQPLIKGYGAVVEDWYNARQVKPLKVEVPGNVAWGKAHEPIKESVTARSEDIQIIVVAKEDLKGCSLQKPGCTFYQITLDGVKVWTWTEGDEGMELAAKELDEIKPKKVQTPTQTKRPPDRDVKRTIERPKP